MHIGAILLIAFIALFFLPSDILWRVLKRLVIFSGVIAAIISALAVMYR